MNTITEPTERQVKRPLGHLQAKIDEPLLDRTRVLAARRKCPPRDIVEEALEQYLPKAERAFEKSARGAKAE